MNNEIELIAAKYDVTAAGVKLLEYITNPEARTMSVTAICKAIDINRGTYYNLFRDDRFKAAYSDLCKTMLLSAAVPAVQALAHQGAHGDVAAIKMILEMAGIYAHQTNVNVNHDVGPNLLDMYHQRKGK